MNPVSLSETVCKFFQTVSLQNKRHDKDFPIVKRGFNYIFKNNKVNCLPGKPLRFPVETRTCAVFPGATIRPERMVSMDAL
jgi:hypothetical protein